MANTNQPVDEVGRRITEGIRAALAERDRIIAENFARESAKAAAAEQRRQADRERARAERRANYEAARKRYKEALEKQKAEAAAEAAEQERIAEAKHAEEIAEADAKHRAELDAQARREFDAIPRWIARGTMAGRDVEISHLRQHGIMVHVRLAHPDHEASTEGWALESEIADVVATDPEYDAQRAHS